MHTKTRLGTAVLLLSLLAIFTSCSITFDNEPADEQDLSSLVTFNRSVSSFVSMLAADTDATGDRASARTVNIGLDTESSVDMFSILDDGAGGSKSPLEIYDDTQYRPSGSIARVPSTSDDQLIENFYNDEALEAYFTLSPTSDDDYLEVDLYVYDRSSLYLEYEYENYLVRKDDTAWNYYRDTSGTIGFIELSSHYYDGTVLQKDTDPDGIIFPDWSVFDNQVYDISFPEISQTNLEDYSFDFLSNDPTFTDPGSVSYTEPARTQGDGDFYLMTLGSMEDARISRTYEVLNYYAEYDSQDIRNGLSFIIKPLSFAVGNDDRSLDSRADVGNSRDYIRTVVRSHAIYDGNSLDSRSIRSLTEFNNSFESQEITIEHDADDLVVFSQENREYDGDDLGSVKVLGVYEMQESTSSTAANRKYTGSYAETKNGKTTDYNVLYEDGDLTLTRAKKSRGYIGQEFSVDLDDLRSGSSFELRLSGGGLFSGYLSSGAFIGTYTPLGGSPQSIMVDSGTVILDGQILEE